MKLLKNHCNDVQSVVVRANSHVKGENSREQLYMKKWQKRMNLMPLCELSHLSVKFCQLLDLYINGLISFELKNLTPINVHEIQVIITFYIENDLDFMFLSNHSFLMRNDGMRVLDNLDYLVNNLRRDYKKIQMNHTAPDHQNHCQMRNRIRSRRT